MNYYLLNFVLSYIGVHLNTYSQCFPKESYELGLHTGCFVCDLNYVTLRDSCDFVTLLTWIYMQAGFFSLHFHILSIIVHY